MKTFLRDNGLTIVLTGLFLAALAGMIVFGQQAMNQQLAQHGRSAVGLLAYLVSGDFLSALFENWESEFLQMAIYVVLTAMLFQRGSAESRDPDEPPEPARTERSPHPVRRWIYEHSLGLCLALLFLVSFGLHAAYSLKAANADALLHGGAVRSVGTYLSEPQLWFESFQNWQSEFLSTAALVVLSIFLRHRGSPESKPVDAAHADTGGG